MLQGYLAGLAGLGLALIIAGAGSPAYAVSRVDACMAIGLDFSPSISREERRLEFEGLATALGHPRFVEAVRNGPTGAIGLTVFQWAGRTQQEVLVPWARVGSESEARAVGEAVSKVTFSRVHGNGTAPGYAIAFGAELLASCPWFGSRMLLNMVGDGVSNAGPSSPARDQANARGVIINGLVISGDPSVTAYYERSVTGPAGLSFVVTVNSFDEFTEGMLKKLIAEIAQPITRPRPKQLAVKPPAEP